MSRKEKAELFGHLHTVAVIRSQGHNFAITDRMRSAAVEISRGSPANQATCSRRTFKLKPASTDAFLCSYGTNVLIIDVKRIQLSP